MLRGSLAGRGVWRRMDAYIWIAKSLRCPPETTTTLFVMLLYVICCYVIYVIMYVAVVV